MFNHNLLKNGGIPYIFNREYQGTSFYNVPKVSVAYCKQYIENKTLQHKVKMASGLSKISGERWTSHLKSIFTSTRDNMSFPSDSLTQGPLDYEISVDELLIASHILKPNKASGRYSISNDMIGCLLEVFPIL